jgi:hypothetical protein
MSIRRDGRTPEKMTAVSKDRPCPVCGKDHKCSRGDGGLLVCGRTGGQVDGFVHLGPARNDPQFHLYRVDDGETRNADRGPRPRPSPAPRVDWAAEAERFAAGLTAARRQDLAADLRLPDAALDALPRLGFDARRRCWTIPECDADGTPVGIGTRFPGGRKRQVKGSARGLILPDGWAARPGPLLVVEGASDALAGSAAGLAVVGRPSSTGGVEFLARLVARLPDDRVVVVVGENDAKPDGRWPGRDGATRTAAALRDRLGRPVRAALPPDGAKDLRAWLVSRTGGPGGDWAAAGREFVARLTEAAVAAPAARPRVVVRPEEYRTNDEAAAALAGVEGLYQRGDRLVRVTTDPPPPGDTVRRPAGPRVEPVPLPAFRELLTRVADWRRPNPRGGAGDLVSAHPPPWAVQAVYARGRWAGVPPLELVVPYPVLLPDGRVLAEPGYDAATGLLYRPAAAAGFDLPPAPDRDACVAAAARLADLVGEMPFVGPAHAAAWLAAALTPPARFAFPGPAPLFLFEANTPGAGKTLLARVAGLVATGEEPAVTAYPADQDELRKRVTAVAVGGDPLVLFDNVAGRLGGPVLDMLLTGTAWQDRLLGTNTMVRTPLYAVWYATANNCEVVGDTARRVLPVRLEAPDERPEDRAGFRRPNLAEWVRARRAAVARDALTILAGFHRAGRPGQGLGAWGSFGGWSDLVRNAVVWCGLPDPCDTRAGLREAAGGGGEAMAGLLRVLEAMDPDGRGLTAAGVVRAAESPPLPTPAWHAGLQAVLGELLPKVNAHALGCLFRSARRRNYGGRCLDRIGAKGEFGVRWVVRPAAGLCRPPGVTADAAPAPGLDPGNPAARPACGLFGDDGFLPD